MKDITYDVLESLADKSITYQDIKIGDYNIPFIAVGENGIYLIAEEKKNLNDLILIFKEKVSYSALSGLYVFNYKREDDKYVFIYRNQETDVEDIVDAFRSLYENTQLPYTLLLTAEADEPGKMLHPIKKEELMDGAEDTGEPTYVKSLISEIDVTKITAVLDEIQNNVEGTKIDNEGNVYKQYRDTSKMFGVGEKRWYRLSENDPDKEYLFTVLTGWFGGHKFKEKRLGSYLAGIFYACTCGCIGINYVYDLITMILGRRFYRTYDYDDNDKLIIQKVYYGPLKNKRKAIMGIVVAIIFTVILMKFVYEPLYKEIITLVVDILTKAAEAKKTN